LRALVDERKAKKSAAIKAAAAISKTAWADALDEPVIEALEKLGRPAKCAEIAQATGLTAKQTTHRLKHLKRRGRVTLTMTRKGPRSARWSLV
jgi:DNA-binding HxlR family transcriptional regulator